MTHVQSAVSVRFCQRRPVHGGDPTAVLRCTVELMTLESLPQDLEKTLEPLLFYYKAARRADEGFGDFCSRVGFPALEAYAASYISPTASESLPQVSLSPALGSWIPPRASNSLPQVGFPVCLVSCISPRPSHTLPQVRHHIAQGLPYLAHSLRVAPPGGLPPRSHCPCASAGTQFCRHGSR